MIGSALLFYLFSGNVKKIFARSPVLDDLFRFCLCICH